MVLKLPSLSPRRFFGRLVGKIVYPTHYANKFVINPLYDFANTDKIANDLQTFIRDYQQAFIVGLTQAAHQQDATINHQPKVDEALIKILVKNINFIKVMWDIFSADMQAFLIQTIVLLENSIETYQEKLPIEGLNLTQGQNRAKLEIKRPDITKNPALLINHLIRQDLILEFADTLKNNADQFKEINPENISVGERKSREKLHRKIQANLVRLLNLRPWGVLGDNKEWEIKTFPVDSSHGTKLDTIEIKKQGSAGAALPYIIHFNAQGTGYRQFLEEITYTAIVHDKNVISFNARGIDGSTGKNSCIEDMVDDGIAQVNRLLKLGVPKENITLDGISFGGAIAVLVAKYFKENRGIDINVIANRTFSTLTKAAAGLIQNYIKPALLGKFLANVATPFIKLALVLAGWEMDVAAAYKILDQNHKAIIVVRSPAKERAEKIAPVDDEIIPYNASLAKALKPIAKIQKEKQGHYSKDAERGIVLKVHCDDPNADGHLMETHYMKTRSPDNSDIRGDCIYSLFNSANEPKGKILSASSAGQPSAAMKSNNDRNVTPPFLRTSFLRH